MQQAMSGVACRLSKEAVMSSVIHLLQRQHREVLARIERDIDNFGVLPTAREFLDFLAREVVTHFRIEEEALFPELAQVTWIANGPLRVMDAEHAAFRDLLAAGTAARDRDATDIAIAAARDLARLLRAHIAKEDDVLFPMALEALDAEQWRRVDAAYRQTDRCSPG
jgi:hemerythrin-like domain-containing protein